MVNTNTATKYLKLVNEITTATTAHTYQIQMSQDIAKKKKWNHLFATCSIESVYCGPKDGCDFTKAFLAKKQNVDFVFYFTCVTND